MERLSTPVFWPGKWHGLYSPWGHKESDTTEWLSLHFGYYQHVAISNNIVLYGHLCDISWAYTWNMNVRSHFGKLRLNFWGTTKIFLKQLFYLHSQQLCCIWDFWFIQFLANLCYYPSFLLTATSCCFLITWEGKKGTEYQLYLPPTTISFWLIDAILKWRFRAPLNLSYMRTQWGARVLTRLILHHHDHSHFYKFRVNAQQSQMLNDHIYTCWCQVGWRLKSCWALPNLCRQWNWRATCLP